MCTDDCVLSMLSLGTNSVDLERIWPLNCILKIWNCQSKFWKCYLGILGVVLKAELTKSVVLVCMSISTGGKWEFSRFLSRQISLAASSHRISTDASHFPFFPFRVFFLLHLFFPAFSFLCPFFNLDWPGRMDPTYANLGWPVQTQMDPDRLELISFAVLFNI